MRHPEADCTHSTEELSPAYPLRITTSAFASLGGLAFCTAACGETRVNGCIDGQNRRESHGQCRESAQRFMVQLETLGPSKQITQTQTAFAKAKKRLPHACGRIYVICVHMRCIPLSEDQTNTKATLRYSTQLISCCMDCLFLAEEQTPRGYV
jgi:hypothetical protein